MLSVKTTPFPQDMMPNRGIARYGQGSYTWSNTSMPSVSNSARNNTNTYEAPAGAYAVPSALERYFGMPGGSRSGNIGTTSFSALPNVNTVSFHPATNQAVWHNPPNTQAVGGGFIRSASLVVQGNYNPNAAFSISMPKHNLTEWDGPYLKNNANMRGFTSARPAGSYPYDMGNNYYSNAYNSGMMNASQFFQHQMQDFTINDRDVLGRTVTGISAPHRVSVRFGSSGGGGFSWAGGGFSY